MELKQIIGARRSSRAFSDRPVAPGLIERMLEAARWAPSAANHQPWRFVVVTREAATRPAVEAALKPGNAWARRAPVLIVTAVPRAKEATAAARESAVHDAGLGLMSLILRGVDQGLVAHPMAGWDAEALRAAVGLPEDFHPVTVTAVGYLGAIADLDAEARAKDERPRTRKPLAEIAHDGRFGTPYAATLRAAPERTFEVDLPLRFRDLDAMGHVNNAVIVTLLEQARVAFFAAVFGGTEAADFPFILAEVDVRYRAPIKLGDQLRARLHVTDVARSSFRFRYELLDPRDGRVFVAAASVQVMYDYRAGRPTTMPPAFLAQLEPFVGE